jgi:hypothetical protein
LSAAQVAAGAETPLRISGSTVLDVDYRNLISSADLDFKGPTARSELGLPIGNGAWALWCGLTGMRSGYKSTGSTCSPQAATQSA